MREVWWLVMKMAFAQRLHAIRKKRTDNAQAALKEAHAALDAAHRRRAQARARAERFAGWRVKEVIRIYDALINEEISIQDVHDARAREATLKEREAALHARFDEATRHVHECKSGVETAQTHLRAATRRLKKTDELVAQIRRAALYAERLREEAAIDEFAEQAYARHL